MRLSTKKKRAVALRYAPEDQSAPCVLAVGQGLFAERIVELAREKGIPLHEDAGLVAALSRLEVGTEIPPELYLAVAEVLAFIFLTDARVAPAGY